MDYLTAHQVGARGECETRRDKSAMARRHGEQDIWENMISRNPENRDFETLKPAQHYHRRGSHSVKIEESLLSEALMRDTYPLPVTSDREGYYGHNHFGYWVSGLKDMHHVLQCTVRHSLEIKVYLDIGCASGRVLRHFALNSHVARNIGCDINSRHIEWIASYLPRNIEVFQNTSIPNLQLEDSSVDLVSAFSIFTHIEHFDLAWMMEIKRILRPGGIAWITFHSEAHWENITDSVPRYENWYCHPEFAARRKDTQRKFDRLMFRQRSDRSYTSIVFYNTDFLCSRWGRILDVLEVRRGFPAAQDVIVLRKPSRQ